MWLTNGRSRLYIFDRRKDITVAENKENKRELMDLLAKSEYYTSRRKAALKGEETEEFIVELEQFTAGLWRSLYDLNQEIEKMREKIGLTQSKSNKLEEFLLSQLFDNVTDGVTN